MVQSPVQRRRLSVAPERQKWPRLGVLLYWPTNGVCLCRCDGANPGEAGGYNFPSMRYVPKTGKPVPWLLLTRPLPVHCAWQRYGWRASPADFPLSDRLMEYHTALKRFCRVSRSDPVSYQYNPSDIAEFVVQQWKLFAVVLWGRAMRSADFFSIGKEHGSFLQSCRPACGGWRAVWRIRLIVGGERDGVPAG